MAASRVPTSLEPYAGCNKVRTSLDPGRASARLNLAAVYAELRMVSEARIQALEALRLDPTEARAAALLKALPK